MKVLNLFRLQYPQKLYDEKQVYLQNEWEAQLEKEKKVISLGKRQRKFKFNQKKKEIDYSLKKKRKALNTITHPIGII